MADEVALVAYDPAWPRLYDEEARRLRAVLDPALVIDMQHFGSTAIPGMPAKPIIDIVIATPALAAARTRFMGPLLAIGYLFWEDNPKTDRLFFVKGLPPHGARRTHHVHVTEPEGEVWRRLAFRDHMRARPDDAARYAALKHDLALRFRDDREAYTDAKADFIAAIMAQVHP